MTLQSATRRGGCAFGTRWSIAPIVSPVETVEARRRSGKRNVLARHAAVAHWRASRLKPGVRALLWSVAAGLLFVVLNTIMRGLAISLNPLETQFLRYLMGWW